MRGCLFSLIFKMGKGMVEVELTVQIKYFKKYMSVGDKDLEFDHFYYSKMLNIC